MLMVMNLGGGWTSVYPFVNVSGTWHRVVQVYVNVSGTWKPVYTYQWMVGSWGDCSVSCGGGTQTRTVFCVENGTPVEDALCIAAVGAKPAMSQPCNTQSCSRCVYEETDTGVVVNGVVVIKIVNCTQFIIDTVNVVNTYCSADINKLACRGTNIGIPYRHCGPYSAGDYIKSMVPNKDVYELCGNV